MMKQRRFLLSALALAALPGTAAAEGKDAAPKDSITKGTLPRDSQTGGSAYGDQNRGGTRGFYGYPRRRSVDGGRLGGRAADSALSRSGASSVGTSPYDNTHGSAYYGRDYGAPYFGGGYYDQGTYYRERRER